MSFPLSPSRASQRLPLLTRTSGGRPGQWDVSYYKETLNFAKTGQAPAGVFVFPSDSKLATFSDVGKEFEGFVDHQNKWQSAFSNA